MNVWPRSVVTFILSFFHQLIVNYEEFSQFLIERLILFVCLSMSTTVTVTKKVHCRTFCEVDNEDESKETLAAEKELIDVENEVEDEKVSEEAVKEVRQTEKLRDESRYHIAKRKKYKKTVRSADSFIDTAFKRDLAEVVADKARIYKNVSGKNVSSGYVLYEFSKVYVIQNR